METRLITVLIPVYNERAQLGRLLERVVSAALPLGFQKEIVVVDDGSIDGTTELLQSLKLPGLKVITSPDNGGKGAAIRLGLPHASGEIIVIQDGDCEYDPADIQALVAPIVEGRARVTYGSRFLGHREGMRWPYWLVNKLLVAAVRFLYGVRLTDEATAYKAFHRSVIQTLPLTCRRFEFCPEVTAKLIRRGIRIHEVPVTYRARSIEEGKKVRFPDAVIAFWTLLRYRWWKG